MGTTTAIEWCDHTFNAWRGCQRVATHPACDHCYAEALSKRNPKTLGTWGGVAEGGRRVLAAPAYWRLPWRWNKAAEAAGQRRTVFALSLGDVFEDWAGPIHDVAGNVLDARPLTPLTMNHCRDHLLRVIDGTPWLVWLLLTKRPDSDHARTFATRPNVMIGTSVSDQPTLETFGRPLVRRARGRRSFLSIEPLLGPVDLFAEFDERRRPGWVIVGGESGPHARPLAADWVRRVRNDCEALDVPFFFKQWGEWLPFGQDGEETDDGHTLYMRGEPIRVGKKRAGRTLDGVIYNERPAWFSAPLGRLETIARATP